MASKSKVKISIEPVIILLISLVTVAVFLLNRFVPSLKLMDFFTSPTSSKGSYPFDIKSVTSWIRTVLYIFGTKNISSWIVLAILFFITPDQENNYGTVLIAIMIFLATIFSGVLAACFLEKPLNGAEPALFLLIILDFLASFRKKEIKISSIAALAFLIVYEAVSGVNLITIFVFFAGGLCGSLVSFITVKKSTSKKKTSSKSKKDTATTVVYFDNEADSPRFKNKKSSATDDDETVIGTLEF
ncbi:MAG: hypothetical protein MJ181_05945 [Treponema sp.]|nr:hypothetical protein [Treponema sp.]